MLKKLLLSVVALLAVFAIAGCGADKPKDSADKAILGYSEIMAYGVSDSMAATGMTKKQEEEIQEAVIGDLLKAFAQFPLNDANVQTVTTSYITKMKAAMQIKTEITKDDAEHPVVKVTANVIDQAGAANLANTNEDIQALGVVLGALQANGYTVEQFKQDPDFQKATIECIENYINEFPLKMGQTYECKCEIVKGDDGKTYWAPVDVDGLKKFVNGN
ncbi:MAG: DUF5105 domain-containing protein [Anaerovibrio sp.]|uniref:DUF5105 domain-containing protein n=1 Tax=Anaerovibrio sp. TaxID=1872532 RepID=UPI0025B7B502|nr:DUF5105 domain-containing protein [Anaerovibrio sp.]MBE6099776.1 DUF5105 domain-containing protein [Anaerovibrio sp.]